MHILLEDKSLKKFLARENTSLDGSSQCEQKSHNYDYSPVTPERGSIFLSVVSVVFLMLFLFMGVPAYILYSYDNSWQNAVEKAEIEFATEVVSLKSLTLTE